MLVTGLLLGGMGVSWGNMDDRFGSIKQRNMFGLREPPPVQNTAPPPPPPSTSVKLTGITCLFSIKKAILQVTEQGKPADSKIISEGSREGSVEVVEVNSEAGTVKIINNGQEVTLSFEKDGVKPTAGPPPAPGMLAPPPPGLPLPGIPVGSPMPAAPQTSIPGAYNIPGLGGRSIPGSTTVTPTGSGYIPGAYGNPIVSGAGGVSSPVNGVAFRFDGSGSATPTLRDSTYVSPDTVIDREQQKILMEVNNKVYEQQQQNPGKSRVPPPPPLPQTSFRSDLENALKNQPPGVPGAP